ncbi:MAG: glutamine--fructose-6-phosphate transaminase (isomerizing), partial [Anaerovoracaceae bacterium]
MCGIVGYIGNENAKQIILDGLSSLEYRGYDSAGIALFRRDRIEVRKVTGVVENLVKETMDPEFDSNIAIGHTRWATHGAPTATNAHPHINQDNTIAVVHNG